MALKFVATFALIGICSSVQVEYQHQDLGHGLVHSPVASGAGGGNGYHHDEYHNAPVEYEFQYSVHDEHTGDIKSQQETRKGDTVHGRYELIDSDGHRRIVEYTADDHNGFNAVVHREPTDIKIPIPQVHHVPVHHAPSHHTAVHQQSPVVHHAPLAQAIHLSTPASAATGHVALPDHYALSHDQDLGNYKH